MSSIACEPCKKICVESLGGIAGDMILGALIDLGADTAAIETAFESFSKPELCLDVSAVSVEGIAAQYVRSIAPSAGGEHHHLADILKQIDRAQMSPWARSLATRIFEILAAAEAEVHGGDVEHVHLHEVGALDSVLDVVGIAVALDSLGRPKVCATPLPSGQGKVHTSHGWLSCPVPAVQKVAEHWQVPLVACDMEGETITPTGISVLAATCESWRHDVVKGSRTGIGAGTKRHTAVANVVRIHAF